MDHTTTYIQDIVAWVQAQRLYPSVFAKVHENYDLQTFRLQ